VRAASQNPCVLALRGRRLAGRASATVAAFALAATAVLLGSQASPGATLEAARAARAADPPDTATIEIVSTGTFSWQFTPAKTALAVGGTLTIHNGTSVTHTFTSTAKRPDHKPYFSVKIEPDQTKTVPAVSTLTDGDYRFFCRIHPAMTGRLTVGAGGPVPDGTTFEQRLVQPPRLTGKHIRIVMRRALVRVLPDGPRTPMLTFGGTFPGPTIVRRTGQDTRVTFVNRLPRNAPPVTVHQHAGHQKSRFDGQPDSHLIRRGKQLTYDYPLRDGGRPLPAALRFYHDHLMDQTARSNWFGLQGLFLTTDPRDARIGLPHGRYDIPLDFTDRSFRSRNRLTNPFQDGSGMAGMGGPGMETTGDLVLVNGRYAPYAPVRPSLYRLRLINTSLFSSYNFALSGRRPFTQIGTGSGLLPHPVERRHILLGPAQRADVVVDFRKLAGKRVVLKSVPRKRTPRGAGQSRTADLMQFRVNHKRAPRFKVPPTLARIRHYRVPHQIAKVWRFGLNGDQHWTINGKRYHPKRVDDRVPLGSVQRWKLKNTSDFTHYIHLHEELWRTLRRDGHRPPPWERGYEDTWRLDPGESVVVAARFSDFTGKFMIHCHMLDHEDDGMMATFEVTRR
jgi:FtsP/CotA-like multicopper oxidase with cupredoxin domain/plastocyanin